MSLTRKAILDAMPASRLELVKKTGLTYETIRRHFGAMTEQVDYHVSKWTTGQPGKPVATFSAGKGASVPPPARSIAAERVAASRARAKVGA